MKKLLNHCIAILNFFMPHNARDIVYGTPLFILFVFVGYYSFIDRDPATTIQSARVVNDEVPQGEFLRIRYHVQWNSDCRITGYRVIIDSGNRSHRFEADSRFVMQGEDVFEIPLRVPLDAFPGPAVYEGFIEYECNPLQRLLPLRQELTPRQFTILAAQDD